MTKLGTYLTNATIAFHNKINHEIYDKTVKLQVAGKTKKVHVTKIRMKQIRHQICPIRTNPSQFVKHFEDIEKYLPFCSSKESFSMSKNFTQKKELDKHDTEELREMGAQLIPIRGRNDKILYHHQAGLVYGKQKTPNSGLIYAIRHNEGNYDDEIDEMGHFVYEPPNNPSGFLRYRWNQFLKQEFKIPIFFLAVRWFKIEKEISPKINYVFMISPVTIVSAEEQENKKTFFKNFGNTKNIGNTIQDPLPLKIISVKEAFDTVYDLNILQNSQPIFQNRRRLSSKDEADWAYNNINSTKRGKQIKKWAKKNKKQCPDGSKCQNKLFDKIQLADIAFGHIASQKWCDAFKFDIKDHPYNLYLTCKNCNSALNYRFPHKKLQDKIDTEQATIGDWIRKYKSDIVKF